MIVRFNPSALRGTHWYEYLVRFGLGGAMTVIAGLIASRFGPIVGGLFLAFPAIFPASATLIEKHVRERKEKAGLVGIRRGRKRRRSTLRGCARKFRASGFRARDLADDHVISRLCPPPGGGLMVRRRDAGVAGPAMAVEAEFS
jgi:hypothetical protein